MNQNSPTSAPSPGQPHFGPAVIGVIAGLVSAVLFASASTGTVLGTFVLFFLSPLPIGIAALGWGARAAAIGAGLAAVVLGVGLAPRTGIVHVAAIGLPTAIAAHYLLLNRETGNTDVVTGAPLLEWYPLGRIIAGVALFAGLLSAISLLAISTDIDGLKQAFRQVIERNMVSGLPSGLPTTKTGPGGTVAPADVERLTQIVMAIAPVSVAAVWFAFANLNLWLAALVTHKSGRLSRPWSDLTLITLPRVLLPIFAGAVALSFTGGMPGLLATSLATAILMGYLLVGLAILHNITRGVGIRSGLLWGVYTLLFLMFLMAAPLIALLGLAEPLLPIRRRITQSIPQSPGSTGPGAPPSS
jgi:hypothetical protein